MDGWLLVSVWHRGVTGGMPCCIGCQWVAAWFSALVELQVLHRQWIEFIGFYTKSIIKARPIFSCCTPLHDVITRATCLLRCHHPRHLPAAMPKVASTIVGRFTISTAAAVQLSYCESLPVPCCPCLAVTAHTLLAGSVLHMLPFHVCRLFVKQLHHLAARVSSCLANLPSQPWKEPKLTSSSLFESHAQICLPKSRLQAAR